jgi:uncharacterized phage protein (TIGR02216 family)
MSHPTLDWPALLKLGLREMGLSPRDFWALTPAEFLMMLGDAAAAPMARARFDALAARFPDTHEKETRDGGDRSPDRCAGSADGRAGRQP